ncbi:MAG: DUF58 domain-containing protein [Chromatiales bacterium]|nr:DUF58 domain-containing protein [Chromatiales bacterium]
MNPLFDSPNGDGARVELDRLIDLRQQARRLDIAPRGKVFATRGGGHLSRFRGRGMEFDESRIYQPGDDTRNMDWRVTARTGQPHVKLYREERERPVWLLVDVGPSMRFGTRVAFKSVIAARAAALLAWAAADKGDRVGGLVFDETRHFERRPVTRTRGLLPLLQALSQDPLPGEQGGHASLGAAARQLAHLVRPGSLVFLFSDFAGIGPEDVDWLGKLSADSEVVLVFIHDPLEAMAPPPALYPVADDQRTGLLDTANSAVRDGWNQRFAAHVAVLQELALSHQTHLVRLRTDQPVGETLMESLRPRGGRVGGLS